MIMKNKLDIENMDFEKLELIMNATLEMAKKTLPKEELVIFQEFIDFRKMFSKESDRGSALMSAAFIDDKLGQLIEHNMVDNKKARESIFDNSGALGTFSGKINIAYLMGLIPKNINDDIQLIRKIRNDFAHNASSITFDTNYIASRCYSLNLHALTKKEGPRAIFGSTVTSILSYINGRLKDSKRPQCENNYNIDTITDIIKKSSAPTNGKKV